MFARIISGRSIGSSWLAAPTGKIIGTVASVVAKVAVATTITDFAATTSPSAATTTATAAMTPSLWFLVAPSLVVLGKRRDR